MPLRQGHGKGAARPHVEIIADELPHPVPADDAPMTGIARRQNGTLGSSEAAKALGARGGRVKATRVRLARSLGLGDLEQSDAFKPYLGSASAFRRHHCRELARQAGGECGSGPSSMVASAALQLAASRFLFTMGSQTGDPAILKQASALANDSRQNLLAAYELAVRSAAARPKGPVDPLAAFRLATVDAETTK